PDNSPKAAAAIDAPVMPSAYMMPVNKDDSSRRNQSAEKAEKLVNEPISPVETNSRVPAERFTKRAAAMPMMKLPRIFTSHKPCPAPAYWNTAVRSSDPAMPPNPTANMFFIK